VVSLCGTGKQQSPIDINKHVTQVSDMAQMKLGVYKNLDQADNQPTVKDTGYTVKATFPGSYGSNGVFQRKFWDYTEWAQFESVQLHIHAPSEHTVNGYHYDAELHIVHAFANGSFGGVLGIFFDRNIGGDVENQFMAQILNYVQNPNSTDQSLMLGDFVQGLDQTKFYSYPGSLTTPPCWENIKWNVFMEVQSLSEDQFSYFRDMWHNNPQFFGHGNYRRPQPMNGRIVQASQQPAGWPTLKKFTGYSGANQLMTVAAAALGAITLNLF